MAHYRNHVIKYSFMETKKDTVKEDSKEWANPAEPTKTTDSRDEEQVLRQYNEAKRRKDNLTENQEKKEGQ